MEKYNGVISVHSCGLVATRGIFLVLQPVLQVPIVQSVDERDKGGNNLGSDEDELEMYLYGGSVYLRNILKR